MPKSSKDRAIFKKGRQRSFLVQVRQIVSLRRMARTCSCAERTIREWIREQFSMPVVCVLKLSRLAKISVPKDFYAQKAYAHLSKAGKKGYLAAIQKYGAMPTNEKHRTEAWHAWWEREGKNRKYAILAPRPIRRPPRNAALAEFIGVMMGDGTIARYQIAISLNRIDDRNYARFIA